MKTSNFLTLSYPSVPKPWAYCVNDCTAWLRKLLAEEKPDEKKFPSLIVFSLSMVVYSYFVCAAGLITI